MLYKVNEQTVATLPEVAAILGATKVTAKDVKEGGKYAGVVSILDETSDTEDSGIEASDSDTPPEEDTDIVVANGSEITKEEAIEAFLPEGDTFKDLDELKGLITDIDTPTLEYLAKAMECDYTPSDHAQIHRMRIAQSLHHFFFPDLFQPKEAKKKKTKYGDLSDDELTKLASTHKVKWDKSGHAPIDRMRIIMALKKAGHLPE